MAFITVAIQGGTRYLLVDSSYVTNKNGQPLLNGDAEGFVVDDEDGTASVMLPVDSIVAHGHGTWEFRENATTENETYPNAENLLNKHNLSAPAPTEKQTA